MKIENRNGSSEFITVSRAELAIFQASLNEVCHAIEVPEFDLRIGVNKDVALALLRLATDTLDQTR
ncbi:hypothetical protein [Rhizobium rhizogenes]|nr:hypothetical protein [Rhizobium rhizogenes]